jgi:alanine racemase
MWRRIVAKVSKAALQHNLRQIKQAAPKTKILAMVKANAYGHGLVFAAKALEEADAFGVASLDEALTLRQAGIKQAIMLMEGIFHPPELALVQQQNLILVVHHWEQVEALVHFKGEIKRPFKVWLKINTGMNRLGLTPSIFGQAYDLLKEKSTIEIVGFMTHFAEADDKENDATLRQLQRFEECVGNRPGQRSLANSAAILAWPQTHAQWIRPGLILYGASPFSELKASHHQLIPAMSLQSEIIAIRELQPGEKVGYGGTWQNNKERTIIGIVAIGYGDGYPWHAKTGTPVLVNGKRVQTVGRVSMDMLAVDLTALPQVKVGDSVVLWGPGLPVEEVAAHASTIPYELFCRLTERVMVQYVV